MKTLSWMLAVTVIQIAALACQADEPDEPLPPLEAARGMIVPDGFHVTLLAGEPDVKQPIGFCIDDRGRLWVAEAYNYPNHGSGSGDRIVIFEDVDGDGRFDNRTVFYDKLNYVTGIEVGFGGAWVMSPPNLYFIPDRNGDDQPDEQPQILLDGFGNHANAHNLANGFAWGPDGWLYGTHGRTNWSLIGKSGTPDDERVRFDGGVYRYHPVRHVWEPFADGTTNPWGIDFDDDGEGFVCNCVNPHLFHVIQGAHYEPWRNRQSSEFAYERIPTIADHLHYLGTPDYRDGFGTAEEDKLGGGHAHCGTMVYLGDNWPDRYRNTVFMHNIHGRRLNNDILRRAGSGYSASHAPDLMRSPDPWFVGVTIQYGPDGAVFLLDWSDTGECHSVKNTRRHTGRIFKIAYGQPTPAMTDLPQRTDLELVQLQLHQNDWYVRHARRLLQERWAAGQDLSAARRELLAMFAGRTEVTRKLRALWALHATGGLDDAFLVQLLEHDSEVVRAWAVRLLCEDREPPPVALNRFTKLAESGDSPRVRLNLASALQRLPLDQRWEISAALVGRDEDADDKNLPLMNWYAIEPLVDEDLDRFVELANAAAIPLIQRHIARRVASLPRPDAGLEALVRLLGHSQDDGLRHEVLAGIAQGLEGRRAVAVPAGWSVVYSRLRQSPLAAVRDGALRLAITFDDQDALRSLRSDVGDLSVAAHDRNRAIEALVAKKDAALPEILLQLVADPLTRRAALRGLAEYSHPETVATILKHYAAYDASARQDAINTLASRPDWATRLLDEMASGRLPRTDLTAFTVRQLHSLGNKDVVEKVERVWGAVRATPADKAKRIAKHKRELTPGWLAQADLSAGRELFQKTCASCHRLFDTGKQVGPDLTGAQRTNLDYVLENLIDPSAAVSKDYRMQIVVTTGGRVITGQIVAEGQGAVTIQTVNDKLIVPRDEIESQTDSPVSMMPEGMLQNLSPLQVRDLVAYLASPRQVEGTSEDGKAGPVDSR